VWVQTSFHIPGTGSVDQIVMIQYCVDEERGQALVGCFLRSKSTAGSGHGLNVPVHAVTERPPSCPCLDDAAAIARSERRVPAMADEIVWVVAHIRS
jgi:hypothetical protein